jgi:Fe-S-cluster containining protein
VLFSQDQRFTCAHCGRCCRRATVPITAAEAEAYGKAGAARWFSEGADGDATSGRDPFEPIPGHAPLLSIRKRADGACGFLSAEGLCRIHEELGADRKPLACRLFPFRFHSTSDGDVATASFACPTVIANEGAPVPSQARELRVLHAAWTQVFPGRAARIELIRGHSLSSAMLAGLRGVLGELIDSSGPDGSPDLVANLRRMAAFVEDLTRRRVLRLAPDAFAEYFELMSRHVLMNDKPPATRQPSRLSRLLLRGFVLSVISVQLHLDPVLSRRRLALRLTLLRVLAHLHGLGPGTAGFDLRRAASVRLSLDDKTVREIAHRYLRASLDTLGTGRRPVVDEVAMIVAHLNAACVLACMHAAAGGKRAVDAESFTAGLLESADLAHADDGGHLSTLLTAFSGGLEALYLFPPSLSQL